MSMQFVVVGLGRLGLSMVDTLNSLGHEVLGIDRREDVIQDLADDLPNVHLVAADATDEDAMRGLDVDGFDAAVMSLSHEMGLTVVALKPKGGPGTLPDSDTVLHEGDVLVVGGPKEALDRSPLVRPSGR